VVVLDEPVRMGPYGALPEARLVDSLDEGQCLTAVGYGSTGYEIDGEPPPLPQLVYPDDRYRAKVGLLNTNDDALGDMFVKTTGVSLIKRKGEASCHGDLGGSLFLHDQQTIVGVASFGNSIVSRGLGYYQRVDLPRVLTWIRSFL
jgi:hypothetical protein